MHPLRSATPPAPARASALPSWLAAAAAIAAVALGLYSMTLRERVGRLEEQLRDATARAEGVERQLQIAQSSADRARQIADVLDAPDVRAIDLAGQKGAPSANGRAYWSLSRGLVFTAANLPAPAPGRQYQLWVIPRGANPVSAGMLDFNDGRTVALVDPSTASRVGVVAVTLEPAGGVPQPTRIRSSSAACNARCTHARTSGALRDERCPRGDEVAPGVRIRSPETRHARVL